MGRMAAVSMAVAFVAVGAAQAAADRPVVAGGVEVRTEDDWVRVVPAVGNVSDPRTVLVVGTRGVTVRATQCQVSAYRIPADGAAVVVLGWRGSAPEGVPRDRGQLTAMRLKRPMFECFDGRGAVAQIALKGRAYQVNVMAGDRATHETVDEALAVARSFAAAP